MPLRVMLEDTLEYDAQRRMFKNEKIHKDEFAEKGEKPMPCKAFEDHYRSGVKRGRRQGKRLGKRQAEKRIQNLIAAMVQAGETEMLPRLGQSQVFLKEMYRKYNI